ncbi:MAG TPA: polysaccharide pyruvyl transferase family protein [Candidatus Gastranaerophilaceae bacterium]|nr:polysaccharide pyruvyl transferase family protein [Candidatus Gastranaerophilaceae bacterium]
MKSDFLELEKIIKEKSESKPIYYIPNPGNWGDAIIRYATLKFFKDTNIKYEEIKNISLKIIIKAFFKGATFIYGGGGAWCNCWNHSQHVVNKILDLKKICKKINVIILPSTFENTYDLPEVTVFVRDKFESKENMPQGIFCHDMSFYIDKMNVLPGDEIGYLFRTDKESSGSIIAPKENIDISSMGNELSDVNHLYKFLSKYSVIHTDRMHIAIAGCHLQREVHLYQGGYFKNKAIYQSSLKDNFDNVFFHEEFCLKETVNPPFLMK